MISIFFSEVDESVSCKERFFSESKNITEPDKIVDESIIPTITAVIRFI
jgi:hypothetical protein